MSPLESRAWLNLWSLCPPYAVYFLLINTPAWPASILGRIACLAAAALVHAAVFLAGLLWLKSKERGGGVFADERDWAIDARASRAAYLALMAGAILVGMVMPFSQGGWRIVNAALLAIVLAETLRNGVIARAYRGTPRFAQ